MKIEDAFTTLRIMLAPAVMALIFAGKLETALYIYIVAAITDMFDGYFARKNKRMSKRGELFDSLADFTLVYLTVFAIVITQKWTWLVVLIIVSTALLTYFIGIISIKSRQFSIPHLKSSKIFAWFVHPAVMAYIVDWRHAGILLFLALVTGVYTALDYAIYAMKYKSR